MSSARRSDSKNNYIPTDYDDLYRYYIEGPRSLCSQIIRKMLPYATEEELEVLPQDVFARILDKDMITVFDPTKANFGGVIFFVTRTIVGNHLDRKGRNPLTGLNGGSLATSEEDSDDFEPGAYSLSRLFGSPTPRYEEQLDARQVLANLWAWAKALHDNPRHKRDESLYPLLNLIADSTDPKTAAQALGVTTSTISNWTAFIRERATEIRDELIRNGEEDLAAA